MPMARGHWPLEVRNVKRITTFRKERKIKILEDNETQLFHY